MAAEKVRRDFPPIHTEKPDAPVTEKRLPFLSIQLNLQMSMESKLVQQHTPEGAEGVQIATHTRVSSIGLMPRWSLEHSHTPYCSACHLSP